jgi:hypothetical protein
VVSHDDVTAKLRPALIEHGIVYFPVDMTVEQDGNRTQMKVTIRFQNIDDKEDYINVPAAGYGIDNQDKGPGKAISYATKMVLLKLFSLETGIGEDPDFDQTTEHTPRQAVKAKIIDKGLVEETIISTKSKIQDAKAIGDLLSAWADLQKIGVDNIPSEVYNELVEAFKVKKASFNIEKEAN